MMNLILTILLVILKLEILHSENKELLLISNRDTNQNIFTALVTNDYQIFHQWDHPSAVHSTTYFQNDSTLIVPLVIDNPIMPITNKPGGRFQKLNWANEVIWDFNFYDTLYTPHHDIEPLPNGNILVICWEVKSTEEALSMGRQSILNEIWPTMIAEVQPPNGDLVWKWHLWDHLIQDVDESLPNYGEISEHPELFNINLGGPVSSNNGDWLHVNAIDYNERLDQIIISSRHMNEIYIIDHSTTIEEAASHSGGNSGKGGDILYRWGNPINYERGTNADIRITAPHAVNWVDENYPGGNNILIFNNNPEYSNSGISSEVLEIQPPIDLNENYFIIENEKFGPEELFWSYGGDSTFFSGWQSSVERLKNGNTLITVSQQRYIFEVDSSNNIVWECHTGANLGFFDYPLRCTKINFEYLSNSNKNKQPINEYKLFKNYPNPFNPFTILRYELPQDSFVDITVYDMLGSVVNNLVKKNQNAGFKSVKWDATNNHGEAVSAGVYLYKIQAENFIQTNKMVLLK